MNNILTIARAVMKGAVRSRVILILILLFLGSSLISLYVGSSTIRTETAAYDMALQVLNGADPSSL
ncbi:MAG: hypothetical protein JXA95_01480, partial [Spirochaetales bacterium]|nr:hypothetical protein [Spirochaetales bacterium]